MIHVPMMYLVEDFTSLSLPIAFLLCLIRLSSFITMPSRIVVTIDGMAIKRNGMLAVIIGIGIQGTGLSRYFQLTLASLDRFYSICKPFEYSGSKLINNIGKYFLLVEQ